MCKTVALGLDNLVSEWVIGFPATSRVFEKNGIDYCCGGAATLRAACETRGLDREAVMAELLALGREPPQRDWSTAALGELVDHIEKTHHAYLKTELLRIARLVHHTREAHGAHYAWLADLQATYDRFAAEMHLHMFKEEQILFPRIRQLENQITHVNVSIPVTMMEHEHQRAGADLEKMRTLTGGYVAPAEACTTFRAMVDALRELETDTHMHVHKENDILFPRAVAAAR